MPKPLLIDFCCKEGGAGRGYAEADFDVIGVDLEPQPRYPFPFLRANALGILEVIAAGGEVMGRRPDALHASPHCQGYTSMRYAPGAVGKPREIAIFRAHLKATGLPYQIENVGMARSDMVDPVLLCGSMFGLQAQGFHLQRHRWFEANWPLAAPKPCAHQAPVAGIYGGHVRVRAASAGGRRTRDLEGHDKPRLAAELMGVPAGSMTMNGLSEAIPPAFTKHIGLALMDHLASLKDGRRATQERSAA